ncbi:S-layer homology domain-containing protein [Paenibacillus sp. sptzw28]|uniref:S-layer homology domain-containing protein n=1 Tax=Paenibacillus sp. sptzw28 TaxID=715179 RepID=UPI0021636791|nr:S-layer homology domain-containing protein [Paenibacillus sp. sptzw28]
MLSVIMLLFLAASQSVWAFTDTKNDPNASKIADLQKQGIITGDKDGLYKPGAKLTYAAGIALIVKGLGLNIDNIRFIKEPKASDYFTKVKDNVWYSDAFIIAANNGLEVAKDVDPSWAMTREQFAHHLFRAIMTTGDYAFIEIYVMIHDESDVSSAYMESIQKLLITKIAELDKKQNFYPKAEIKRGEAAGWLYGAMKFVKENVTIPAPGGEPQPTPLTDVAITAKAVNETVTEVTVTAKAPNPGYGLRISSILFDGDKAIINVEPVFPQEDKFYAQVITDVKAVTYIASDLTPVLGGVEIGGGSSGSSGISPPTDPDHPVSSTN